MIENQFYNPQDDAVGNTLQMDFINETCKLTLIDLKHCVLVISINLLNTMCHVTHLNYLYYNVLRRACPEHLSKGYFAFVLTPIRQEYCSK